MKSFLTLLCLSFLLIPTEKMFAENPIHTFSDLQSIFKDPPSEYRTSPLWVWNDKVTEKKIDHQLDEFKKQGFGGVFIHPRPGLITEYLSNEWGDLLVHTLEKGKSLDLEIWMYDENTFPSGYAGGNVQRDMPSSINQGQGLRMEQTADLSPNEIKDVYLALKMTESGFENVTANLADAVRSGEELFLFYKTFNSPNGRLGGKPYPDLLIPGVTEKFMEITMPLYEEKYGHEFGKSVPGIFTDEPNINPPTRESVKWTPSLFQDFQQRYGYDLKDHLPSLFTDTDEFRQVRHNYYQLLSDLFVERWSKPWFEYTEEKNLKWTGHYWEHAWPNPRHGGDNMVFYAYHQMPGIDMLFNTRDERPDQFGNVLAVRELRSVANQMGYNRTLSETYGGSGWSLTFEDMKRHGDWEYVIGVNFMNQHLSYMTFKGARKRDFPQSISYQVPWWGQYHTLADRYGRLSAAMSAGEQINSVLVLHPNTTTWMYFTPEQSRDYLGTAGDINYYADIFKDFVSRLEMHHIEYDLGGETNLRDFAKVEGNRLVIEKRAYDIIVIPPTMENLNMSTFELLRSYLANGGQVISFGELPVYINGSESPRISTLYKNYKQNWKRYQDAGSHGWTKRLASTDFQVKSPETIGGELYHHRRILEDGQIIFWMNYSENESANVTFTIPGESLLSLDLQNGEIYSFPAERTAGKLNAVLTLPPGGSKLLFAAQNAIHVPPARTVPPVSGGQQVQAQSRSISREAPNVLPLDYCNLDIMGKQFGDMYYIAATDSIYKFHGFDRASVDHNPWNFAVQYKQELVERNTFPEGSGFTAEFPFHVQPGFQPTDMKLAVEWGDLYNITVNGKSVGTPLQTAWLDNSITLFEIGALVKPGANFVTLTCRPMDIHAELERVFLLGNFNVEPARSGFTIQPAQEPNSGSWHSQGLPFYPHSVIYTQEVQIDDVDSFYGVRLPDWKGTVAAVRVNDKDAGIIAWQPYVLDISDYVSSGKNTIQVSVYGSFKNLLGPHHNVNRYGIVTPWSWNSAPPNQPAGETYDLFQYGLMEDFQVISYN